MGFMRPVCTITPIYPIHTGSEMQGGSSQRTQPSFGWNLVVGLATLDPPYGFPLLPGPPRWSNEMSDEANP